MVTTWFAIGTFIVAAVATSRPQLTTEVDGVDASTEDPLMTEIPPTTHGYLRKYSTDWFDDYDDPEDDDAQLYDDEFEEDLQSDAYRAPHSRYYNSEETPSKRGERFWNTYRPSHSVVRFSGSHEDAKSQEEVKKHHSRVTSEVKCHYPQPRVIRVLEHHPSSSKTYLPSCTVLHQCADNTGCCPLSKRCGPKRTEKIELPFYAIHEIAGISSHHPRKTLRIEKLVFYNHTECECLVRSDEMPRDVLPTPDPPEAEKCRCPSPFNVRNLPGHECGCDCFDKQRDCIKYKKGKDYLNHEDRLCIETRKCLAPTCDYGNYIRRSGRCPRKDEKYRF